MSTYMTVHNVNHICASTTGSSGAPLHIDFCVRENLLPTSVTIFTGDQILTDMLIDAINGAVEERKLQIAALTESEAA